MTQMIFVNLPVKDLEVSKAFFTKLGYSVNAQFTDENASSIVISDTIFVMLLKESFFQTFTKRTIADTATTVESLTCLSAESRDAVDELVDTALASGGSPAQETMDHGFMYGRSFLDPDGHHWEVVWMDPSAIQS
ncbi:VOC family protein [Streptomyces beijiangensis]|uniref:VOC family protein n=1 Tax=Streptomyces beijiangensis TaxID=163361 RepID=A0A939FAC1_9ACTN|nr:VOC family protein [Streptomyces beijiangensis]MBO0514873.1 VOC family protein [Streptomyces beijiangensis]